MEFEVHCDESRPDLFASQRDNIGQFMLVGSVWFRAADKAAFKDQIKALRLKHHTFGEAKWRAVAPSRLPFYLDLIDWFFSKGLDCRFRCIVVEAANVNLPRFHESDQELGFYKFYYQLLHHWILDFNRYRVFLDHKRNREKDRLKVLHRCLQRANLSSRVELVQSLDSGDSQFIQLADVLTGAVASRFHGRTCSVARLESIHRIESQLDNKRIGPTPRSSPKFNVFWINLSGGW